LAVLVRMVVGMHGGKEGGDARRPGRCRPACCGQLWKESVAKAGSQGALKGHGQLDTGCSCSCHAMKLASSVQDVLLCLPAATNAIEFDSATP
jgi:hypothetical protein